MKKRLISLISIISILASLLVVPHSVNAAETYTEGYYTYTVSNGNATITDVSSEISGSIIIPKELGGYQVTKIDYWAFKNNLKVSSVDIPETITEIAGYAFNDCKNLSKVKIPDSVKILGDAIFEDCPLLKTAGPTGGNYNIEYGWKTELPTSAFDSCNYLEYINIANSITFIGALAFQHCERLSQITLPYGITKIGHGAFNVAGITSIEIPESVVEIEGGAFLWCRTLSKVEIPNSVKILGESIFEGCPLLKTAGPIGGDYNIEYGWQTTIPKNAFESCYSLEKIDLPNTITLIEERAFDYCTKLSNINIPYGVTKINSDAFRRSGITRVEIPESVIEISNGVFKQCSSLSKVKIPNSVKTLGSAIFEDCPLLKTAGPIGGDYNIEYGWQATIPKRAFYLCNYLENIDIPESITLIEEYAFYECATLSNINIPQKVTEICNRAFYGCKNINSINIPYGVTKIGTYAFAYTGITSIEIPESVVEISGRSFLSCSNLSKVKIPNSVKKVGIAILGACPLLETFGPIDGNYNVEYGWDKNIPDYAFYDCQNLKSITIPETITSINKQAFYKCTSLTDVYYNSYESMWNKISIATGNDSLANATIHYKTDDALNEFEFSDGVITKYIGDSAMVVIPDTINGETVMAVGDSAFIWCDQILSVQMPETIVNIEDSAFRGCSQLTSINISSKVTNIGAHAFSGCNNLEKIELPSTLESIGEQAFFACKKITDLTIPETVTSIGTGALSWCTNLQNVTLPTGLQTIPELMFSHCEKLTSITLPEAITNIEKNAFEYCVDLSDITMYNAITNIGENAFNQCHEIKDVYYKGTDSEWNEIIIEDGNDTLLNATIHYTNYILENGIITAYLGSDTNVVVPSIIDGQNITGIGEWAFADCEMTTVAIPEGITSIGEAAFANCYNLTSINIPSGVTSIQPMTFSNCPLLENVVLPSSITEIGYNAFEMCESLKNITIPEGTTLIDSMAFFVCTNLEWAEIPASVTTIGDMAFFANAPEFVIKGKAGSYAEEYAEMFGIPFEVSSDYKITYDLNGGSGEVEDTPKSHDIDVKLSETIPIREGYLFLGWSTARSGHKVYQPGELFSENKNTKMYAIWEIIPTGGMVGNISWSVNADEVLTISGFGDMPEFDSVSDTPWKIYNDDIEEVIISDGVTSIGKNAFRAFDDLEEITIPETIIKIGDEAFAYCDRLSEINIPASVTNIGVDVFDSCDMLEAINVDEANAVYSSKDGVLYTKEQTAIIKCPADKSGILVLPNTVTTIEKDAFYECDALSSLIIPGKIISIGENAFYKTKGLVNITLSDEVTSIPTRAFYGCTSLKEIELSNNITEIGTDAFADCSSSFVIKGMSGSTAEQYANENGIKFSALAEYSITYDANGGTNAPQPQRQLMGAGIIITDDVPERDGYSFVGWSTNSEAGTADFIAGDLYSSAESVTLYAVWGSLYPESITPSVNSITLIQGDNEQILLTLLPETAPYKNVEWSSDNEAVATVINGLVTGIAPGTAEIKAITENGLETKIAVTVVRATGKIDFSVKSEVVSYGSAKITAEFTGDVNSIASVEWAQGSKNSEYFIDCGNELDINTPIITVHNNGMYSFYMTDIDGNTSLKTINVSGIAIQTPYFKNSSNALETNNELFIPIDFDGVNENITVYTALYDNGKLKDIRKNVYNPEDYAGVKMDIPISYNLVYPKAGYELRAFVWNDNMMPLTNIASVKSNKSSDEQIIEGNTDNFVYEFTVPETRSYTITSYTDSDKELIDLWGYLYDGDNYVTDSDNIGNGNYNFSFTADLVAGTTYTLVVTNSEGAGDYLVVIE